MPPLLALLAAALAGCATAPPDAPTCPTDAVVAQAAARYAALQPEPNPPAELTAAGAACGQAKLVRALAPTHGRVVGWKAGLTNPVMQKRFGVDQPVRGALLEKMMLRDGAEVPAKFGVRPFLEADLLVEVGSSAIHDAKTPLEVLAALKSVIPFIELPDINIADPSKITGPAITWVNVGARLGVTGTPIPVRPDAAFAEALRSMTVRVVDGAGRELDAARGEVILGHPLNAVMWLAADLKRAGITLRPGDLLSLGSFSKGLPTQPGASARVVYEGLPGNPSVSVRFR
ncbi:MAG: 2-keto-4-pentenoate hydratase [Rubrivivax sp.]